jgi:DNA replication and repair protein RecF
MSVAKLTTENFRNLVSGTHQFHPDLNFVIGDNGSGKSSFLESIFFIAHGKSFRTNKIDNLAYYQKAHFVVSVKDNNNCQMGISRHLDNSQTLIKVNGERQTKLSDLARNIAVQIITPESFRLFFGGPKERRRFVDLGMFHVKHDFSKQWSEFNRVLKQRNACIRSKADKATFTYWTDLFCQHSVAVAKSRKEYVAALTAELASWVLILLPKLAEHISVQYLQGWNQKRELAEVLSENIEREMNFGYSLYGAQKFDVKFLINKMPLDLELSRGQQKLFLLALTFAQAKLIEKVNRVKPILLIDDIGAELDINSRTLVSHAIQKLDCQVVISAIDKAVLEPFIILDENTVTSKHKKYQMFHVKHGEVFEMNEHNKRAG